MLRIRYSGVIFALAVAAPLLIAGRAMRPAAAQTQSAGQMMTQTTATYQIELNIEPAMVMLSPDQAQGAAMGEAMTMPATSMMTASPMTSSMPDQNMQPMSSMPDQSMTSMNSQSMMGGSNPTMLTTDNGLPVNHHLEVQISSRSTGITQSDVNPQVTIVNDISGQSRMLDGIAAMYDVQIGSSDLHYGNNLYLQDGTTYTITVTIGDETAQFSHVPVSGGMGLPSDLMSPMSNGSPMQPMAGH
jgi:hypothetical protein